MTSCCGITPESYVLIDIMAAAKKKDLKGATASLFQILEDREKELQKWDEDLSRRESLLKTAGNGAEPDDILPLNVGGRTGITVHRSTLTLIEHSILGAKFSKNWEGGLDKDEQGNIFVDQDPDLFMILVNYLRAKRNDVLHLGVFSPPLSHEFDLMLHYYDLMLGVYPVQIQQLNGVAADATITQYPDFSISATEFRTFDLTAAYCHKRRIKSFKVVVGDYSKLLVGWRDPRTEKFDGVDDLVGCRASIAIDVGKRMYQYAGTERAQELLEQVTSGVTIRLEADATENCAATDKFHWSVVGDDDEVDTEVQKNYLSEAGSNIPAPSVCIPCISLKGDVRIIDIKYE
jgi:BTB/POZ domain